MEIMLPITHLYLLIDIHDNCSKEMCKLQINYNLI